MPPAPLDPNMGIYYPSVTYNCPSANQTEMMRSTVTGYAIIKHWTPNTEDYPMVASAQSATMFRYGEVLLMLAEVEANSYSRPRHCRHHTSTSSARACPDSPSAYLNTHQQYPADPRPRQDLCRNRLHRIAHRFVRGYAAASRGDDDGGRSAEDLIRWRAWGDSWVPLRGMKFTEEKQAIYDGSNRIRIPCETAFAYQARARHRCVCRCRRLSSGFPRQSHITDGTLVWDNKVLLLPIPLQELSLQPQPDTKPGMAGYSPVVSLLRS